MLYELLHPFEALPASYLAAVCVGVLCASLGMFVLLRRIVFVAIAVSEASACGIAFAFFLASWLGIHREHGDSADPWFLQVGPIAIGLVFALITMTVFALRRRDPRAPVEGSIGVGYVVAGGVALILVSKSAQGLEELSQLLAGSVVYISDARLDLTAVTTVVLLSIVWLFHKPFLFCSFDEETALTLGYRARGWSWLLHVIIGTALSVCLYAGGLLLSFAFLVLPPLTGLRMHDRFRPALRTAIAVSLSGATLGSWFCWQYSLPIGPAVAIALAVHWAIVALIGRRWPRTTSIALLVLAAPAIPLTVLTTYDHVLGIQLVRGPGEVAPRQSPVDAPKLEALVRRLGSEFPAERQAAARALATQFGSRAIVHLEPLLEDLDGGVRSTTLELLAEIGGPDAVLALRRHLPREQSDELELATARTLLELGDAHGFEVLLHVLEHAEDPFVRDEATMTLRELTGESFGFEALNDPETDTNRAALRKWQVWWQEHEGRLKRDRETGKYR
ncbi:MAG: iron chelate uptake ABC transporter family permease subunit [Planctomycetota bacterium]